MIHGWKTKILYAVWCSQKKKKEKKKKKAKYMGRELLDRALR